MQWNTGRSYKLDRARHNKQENYEVPINKRKRRFKKGGAIDDKKAMVLSQIKEVHHHADELAKVLANMDTVDAWVVGKMERATTDLSDITHYLDGTTEYAKGGMMDKAKYNLSFNYNPSVLKNSEAEKIVSKYTKDWKHDNDFDEVSFYVMGLTMDKVKELESELMMEDAYNIEITKSRYADGGEIRGGIRYVKGKELEWNDIMSFDIATYGEKEAERKAYDYIQDSIKYWNGELNEEDFKVRKAIGSGRDYKGSWEVMRQFPKYADGGMMAKGGRIKEGDKVIYEGEERTVYSLYPKGMASLCLIDEDGYEYEDVEEDYQVSIKDLTPVKSSKKKN
jgi:hypothetical protein